MKNKLFNLRSTSEIFKLTAVCLIILIFLIIGLVFSVKGNLFLFLFPVVIALVFLAFYSIDYFLLIVVFLTPLSVQLRFIINDPPADLFIPTEVMLFGIFLVVAYKLLISREFPKNMLLHPVSVIIMSSLLWTLITSLTGVSPFVSLKNLLTRLWFISSFYLLALAMFQKKERIRSYLLAYIYGMVPVLIYFLIAMVKSGMFNQAMSHSAIRPFFNDHTSFGASLAFCIPVLFYFVFKKGGSLFTRIIFFILFSIFMAAFVFSYSRAAWLSLIGTIVFVLIILLKIPWKYVFASTILFIIILLSSWSSISEILRSNKQVSTSNLVQHLQSVSNITSDVSNSERINRWKSAIRMFREKPLMGWGPGTYQFEYAPYQIASEKTEISTNFGDGGNAHSEYLGSLVDSGVPALLIYLILIIMPVVKGVSFIRKAPYGEDKFLVIALMAGLVTYVIHGFLNSFLDTDKISALFWGYIAAITAFDLTLNDIDANSLKAQDISAAIIDTSSNR